MPKRRASVMKKKPENKPMRRIMLIRRYSKKADLSDVLL